MTDEQVKFQVVACNRQGAMHRPFEEVFDTVEAAMEKVGDAFRNPEAVDVFVVTVHAAFQKTFEIKRVI